MNNIRAKLIVTFTIIILFSTLSLGIVSLKRSSDSLIIEAEHGLSSTVYEAARLIESRIETQLTALEMIAFGEDMQSMGLG